MLLDVHECVLRQRRYREWTTGCVVCGLKIGPRQKVWRGCPTVTGSHNTIFENQGRILSRRQ